MKAPGELLTLLARVFISLGCHAPTLSFFRERPFRSFLFQEVPYHLVALCWAHSPIPYPRGMPISYNYIDHKWQTKRQTKRDYGANESMPVERNSQPTSLIY